MTFLLLSSCDSSRIFDQNEAISDNVWGADEKIQFDVSITDTVSLCNMYVNVRQSEGYPYSNLFLYIHTTRPDGISNLDTLECVLADKSGKWLGEGLGDLWDNQIPFKKNMRFARTGKYTYQIEQAMRTDQLPLVMDVGIRIEKSL